MAAASDRAEVDTARPFRSVKEALAVFGDRILVGGEGGHSRHSSSAATSAIAAPNANATSVPAAATAPSAKHEASSSSSTMTFSPNPTAESEAAEIMPATTTVPMYSAPSSPASLTSSSPSPTTKAHIGRGDDNGDDAAGLVVMRSIEKLEADVAETRQEVAQLRKRGSEMEMAVASLNAQLHRGLSRLAAMETDRARAAAAWRSSSVGGDTDAASSATLFRWGDKLAASGEYLPSFSHALSLGEMDGGDDAELVGGRRRKAQKVKPIVPLIGDILFARRKSTKEKGDERFCSGDLYSVVG